MARLTTTMRGVAGALLASTIVFVASGLQWQTPRKISASSALGASESPTIIPVEYPSYTPDGREVAFNTFWPGGQEILAVSTVDGRLRWLLRQSAERGSATQSPVHPAWSPDGKWIAFATEIASGAPSNIWLVHPDGSGLTQLTKDSTHHDDEPAWSPDGTRIAFTSHRLAFTSADLTRGGNDIWVVNVDGSGLRQVTKSPQSWLPSLPQDGYHPSFSPDGSQIVFSQGSSPEAMGGCSSNKLVIINADGTGARQLTSGPAEPETSRVFDWYPSWSRQGILFTSRPCGSKNQIMMIQPNGTGLHAILNATGWQPAWSPDGTKFAFVRVDGVYEFNFLNGTIRALVQIKGFLITIHIMPDPSPRVVSLKETTLIRVAIPPQPGFDWVKAVDQTSITFGRSGDERSLDSCAAEGTNLVCLFKTALTGFRAGDTQGILRLVAVHTYSDGSTDRVHFEGRGAIQIAP